MSQRHPLFSLKKGDKKMKEKCLQRNFSILESLKGVKVAQRDVWSDLHGT
jgi:hypothetical protein